MQRYTIEALADAGGMSRVFKARDPDNKAVALKVLDRNEGVFAHRFVREAHMLMELGHPGIVRCLDAGITPTGQHVLVMEWLDGVSLESRLLQQRLSLGDSLALVQRMAQALSVAHRRGIVHRDIKPGNIFLPYESITGAKLLDFGIAHWSAKSALTDTGTQIGTPSYMAPEQIRSDKHLDATADVFSLGCVLYECLSGERAFPGTHPMAIFYRITVEETPRITRSVRDVPESLARLLDLMLAKNPADRPKDGAELADELTAIHREITARGRRVTAILRHVDPSGITASEQHLVCAVVVANPKSATPNSGLHKNDTRPSMIAPRYARKTLILEPVHIKTLQLRYESLGARFDNLVDGSLIAVFKTRAINERADDAARCALELHAALPGRAIAVTTGRVILGKRSPVGEVIERAIALLDNWSSTDEHMIRLDQATSGLIGTRFDIEYHTHGAALVGERHWEHPSTLLGHPTPFVGRGPEMAALESSLRECVDQNLARVVLITGPSGIGKSRLMHEFSRTVAAIDRDLAIVSARGSSMHTSSPLDLIAQIIRTVADIRLDQSLELRREILTARVAQCVAVEDRQRVTAFLGELIKTPWPDNNDVQLSAARRDARVIRDQIRRAVIDFLAAEIRLRPMVLVLEDLQWADRASLAVLDAALSRLSDASLFVLGLARPEFSGQVPDLWSRHDVMELRLRRLHRRAAETLVRAILDPPIEDRRIADIVAHSDGNPLYLEELIRSLAADRETVPGTVPALMHARLTELSSTLRRIMRAASIFGASFWLHGVQSVLGQHDPIDQQLDELVSKELFVIDTPSRYADQIQYRFRHDLIRQAAYHMLTPDDRQLGHRLAGRWLERVGEVDPMMIAEHYERGGAAARAIPLLIRAAINACAVGDADAAMSMSERGVALGATDKALGTILAVQAKVYQWRGQLDDTIAASRRAMELLPRGGRIWYEVAEDAVAAHSKKNDLDALQEFARVSSENRPDGHDRAGWMILAARLIWMLFVRGQLATADALLKRVEAEIQDSGQSALAPELLARVHASRACRAMFVDKNPAGLLLELRRAVACYQQAGDRHNACDQQCNAGFAEVEMGLYRDAEVTLRAALATAEELALDELLDGAKHNLSVALIGRGALSEARALAENCAQSYKERGNQRLAAWCRVTLSRISLMEDDLDAAESQARMAVELCPDNTLVAGTSRAMLSQALLAQGRVEEALSLAAEALAMTEETGGVDQGEALVYVAYAEVLHVHGRAAKAREVVTRARAVLRERAARIDQPAWRHSYLHEVRDHARILALAEQP